MKYKVINKVTGKCHLESSYELCETYIFVMSDNRKEEEQWEIKPSDTE